MYLNFFKIEKLNFSKCSHIEVKFIIMRRKTSQKITDLVSYVFFYGFFNILKMMPAVVYPQVSCIISFILSINASLKKKIRKNLIIAYGNSLSPKQRTLLIKKILKKNTFFFTEFVLWTKLKPEDALKLIEFKNLKGLKKICEMKKPVVLVSGHIGNFSLMIASLIYSKVPLTWIARDANNQYLARFMDRTRRKKGIFAIKKENLKEAIHLSSEWLRNGNTLCLLIDQHSGKGTEVNFFGNKVQAPTGATVFARKYNAIVFGAFISHKKKFRHTISIEGPYNIIRTDNPESDFQINTQFFYNRIEYYVKKNPEEWFTWLHRRFR